MLEFFKEDQSKIGLDEDKENENVKIAFTVSIPSEFNDKFLEIMTFYQSKHKYGRVYKNQVLQLIIDEAHSRLKGSRQI